VKYFPIHTHLRKLSARAGLPWFRGVGVSKRRTQAGTLVLRLMGRCIGLKRPCTGPCLEGRAKKDISMLGSLGSVTNSHQALANGQERYLIQRAKRYPFSTLPRRRTDQRSCTHRVSAFWQCRQPSHGE
jgi:hypothetical protein